MSKPVPDRSEMYGIARSDGQTEGIRIREETYNVNAAAAEECATASDEMS